MLTIDINIDICCQAGQRRPATGLYFYVRKRTPGHTYSVWVWLRAWSPQIPARDEWPVDIDILKLLAWIKEIKLSLHFVKLVQALLKIVFLAAAVDSNHFLVVWLTVDQTGGQHLREVMALAAVWLSIEKQ